MEEDVCHFLSFTQQKQPAPASRRIVWLVNMSCQNLLLRKTQIHVYVKVS